MRTVPADTTGAEQMSITIEQALKLPSLRKAKVLAGKNSLDKNILTVNVLECSELTQEVGFLIDNIKYVGSELAITSFYGIRNDVESQLETIRLLSKIGVIGLVLYYVGIIMPKVDERLVQLADEMNFPLIVMPQDVATLRYSDVISEVSELIIKDQMMETNYSVELLEQMSKLPPEQRTIDSMLYLISNRLHATIIITDNNYKLLNVASWPFNQDIIWDEMVKLSPKQNKKERTCKLNTHTIHVYREEIKRGMNTGFYFYIFSDSKEIEHALLRQVIDGVQLGINLWGREHDQMGLRELVRAIIKDEPIKMRRIANMYHINIAEINDMIIIHSMNNENLAPFIDVARAVSDDYARIKVCEPFEKDILIFYSGKLTLDDLESLSEELNRAFLEKGCKTIITRCNGLEDTTDVKNAYHTNQAYSSDVATVFPGRTTFSLAEFEFVKRCKDIADEGETSIERYISVIRGLSEEHEGTELVKTISCYLLDEKTSIVNTASALFVHKNTVKYRLQKAGNILGFRVGDMPESQNLLYATAIWRLLQKY